MIDNTQANPDFTWELINQLARSGFKYGQACHLCHWQHPDTCIQCQGEHKTIVMSVNKEGVKQ